MSAPRVIVVAKRSAYSRYIDEESDPRARLLLKQRDPAVARWVAAHREHQKTLEKVERVLARLGAKVVIIQRAHAAFDTADADLVVAVGGDGTLLAASHNVGTVPILGVNSAPGHSVGFFCGARRGDVQELLPQALAGTLHSVRLTRMKVSVNGRLRSRRVLNEALYCHRSPAATSRYILRCGRVHEEQRSSGFWIGPAAGSTAAQRSAGGQVLPFASKKLQLVVREPYAPFKSYRLLQAVIAPGKRLVAKSKMQDACIYLDGPHREVRVRLGDETSFETSEEPLCVLGLRSRRSER